MTVPTSVVVGDALARRLRKFPRPTPVAAPLVAHEALKCSRRIGFRIFGVEPDIRYTRAEQARFEDGDHIDNIAGEAFVLERNARLQVPFNWLPLLALKGKADAGYRVDGKERGVVERVVVETKSMGEKGFARQIGMWNNVPAHPKPEWLIQGGLAACSPTIDARWLHVVLCDNDRLGEVAEWLLDVDEPLELPGWPPVVDWETGEIVLPSVRRMVLGEVWRLAGVLGDCVAGRLPARIVPEFGLVLIPPGREFERAEPWQCRYCPFQPTCARLPADAVPDFGEVPA